MIGVELVADAVRDARKNAEVNGVSNCPFFAGRAENILHDVLKDIDRKKIIYLKTISSYKNDCLIFSIVGKIIYNLSL